MIEMYQTEGSVMGAPVRFAAALFAIGLVVGACSDGGSDPAAGTQAASAASSSSASETRSVTSLVPAVSTTSATTVAPETSSATSDPGFLTDSYTPLLPDVVPLLHPGWTYIALRAIDINAYELEIALLAVPTLRARVFYLRNANELPGTRTVVVSGVNWATAPNIDELTSVAMLVTGDLQSNLINSINNDTGFAQGNNGRLITQLGVVSNVEVFVNVLEVDGATTTYTYRLDMTVAPAVFRLVG
jgi:hypothetical protein